MFGGLTVESVIIVGAGVSVAFAKRRLCRIDQLDRFANGIIIIGAGFAQTIGVGFTAI